MDRFHWKKGVAASTASIDVFSAQGSIAYEAVEAFNDLGGARRQTAMQLKLSFERKRFRLAVIE